MRETTSEEIARSLAKWLAPYIRQELDLGQPVSRSATAEYDTQLCSEFVSTLGDVVLSNASVFFGALDKNGEIGSLELAEGINVSGPRVLPSVLTTPLKRRAKALGLPPPWVEGERGGRTLWLDTNGIAGRMVDAVTQERTQRTGRTSD